MNSAPSVLKQSVLGLLSSVLWLSASAQIEVISNGNVGIGTTAPASKLHIVKTGNGGQLMLDNDGSQYTALDLANNGVPKAGLGYDNASSFLYFSAPSNRSVAFFTNDAERLRVTGAGNVGIGTTNPVAKLHILGGDESALKVDTASASDNPAIFLAQAGSNKWEIYGAGGELRFYDYTLGAWVFGLYSGKVGIGTHNPQTALHVQSASAGATALRLTDNIRGTLDVDFPATSQVRLNVAAAEDTLFASGGATLMTIRNVNSGGNVGIGTTNPGHKLEVAGTVRAASFVSNTTTYADFVFKPGYRLAPLSEVEAHIEEHGHLPDIPSEAQVAKEGIDLAAMQVKLLQKIEELTLHLIAQEKRNEVQQADIAALKEGNARLRQQLSGLNLQP